MGDWREFRRMQQYSLFYRATMVSTFALTVMLDITVAVQVGHRAVERCSSSTACRSSRTSTRSRCPRTIATLPDGRRVAAWRVFGALFFGSVTKLEQLIDPTRQAARRA